MNGDLPSLRARTVQRNASLLAEAVGVPRDRPAARAHADALARIQRWGHLLTSSEGRRIHFHGTENGEVFTHFLAHQRLPALAAFTEREVAALTAALTEALDLLAQVNPDARDTFDLLVHGLLIVRIPAFGSLSDALGLVMAGPEADWPRIEIAELLWHEAVHQALFLEDLIHPLFSAAQDDLTTAEARVRNPLLGMARPFDMAFHGALVSVALLDLDLRAGAHQRAAALLPTIAPSLDELALRRHLLTRRGAEILEELVAAARALGAEFTDIAARGVPDQGEQPVRRSYLELQPSWRAGHEG